MTSLFVTSVVAVGAVFAAAAAGKLRNRAAWPGSGRSPVDRTWSRRPDRSATT